MPCVMASRHAAIRGLAADLAHPLHNATGITLMSIEMNGKRLELLHEIAPQITRVAAIANPLHSGMQLERADLEAKGKELGIAVSFFSTPNRAELDQALNTLTSETPQALVALSDAFIVDNRNYIINFAMSRRLPVISCWAVMAENGALCTYGPSSRRVAARGIQHLPLDYCHVCKPSVATLIQFIGDCAHAGDTLGA
jgi:putative ABC transport system substrate-binding protein